MYSAISPPTGGHLIFEKAEGEDFLERWPEAAPFVKKYSGSRELMRGTYRYCLWLEERDRHVWETVPPLAARVEACREWRSAQKVTGDAYKLRAKPWSFRERRIPSSAMVVPAVTSERRSCVPVGFVDSSYIIFDSAFMLPEAGFYDFGILSSGMHNCWLRLTCGRLKSDCRYSRDLVCNTFIWPRPSNARRAEIAALARKVLLLRERHYDVEPGTLYNPGSLPEDLGAAHRELDGAVERAFRPGPFASDEERTAFMLELYSRAAS